MLLVSVAFAFSAQANHEPVAFAESSAGSGTGLFQILDTGECEGVFPGGEPTGRCGPGLDTNAIDAFSQTVSGGLEGNKGVSSAEASVAPIDVIDLATALDLSELVIDITEIDTGTILDGVLGDLAGGLLKTLLLQLLEPVTDALDTVLQTVLSGLDDALPISLQVGAVESHAEATPSGATGGSTVAGLNLLIELGGQQIKVPLEAGTAPNSNLLIGAPQDLVDGILEGLRDTLDESLGGALGALNPVLTQLEDALVDPLLEALEPTLLSALANLLEPIISGTVNKQVPIPVTDGGFPDYINESGDNADGGDADGGDADGGGLGDTLGGIIGGGDNADGGDADGGNADGGSGDAVGGILDGLTGGASTAAANTGTAATAAGLEVTALELIVLGDNELDLARVRVGPNSTSVDHDADVNADVDADVNADVDADGRPNLPNTGGSTVLPLTMLALLVTALGGGMMLNRESEL